LAKLVMHCLEKDPHDRPRDMIEVAKLLDPYYMPTVLDAQPQSPPTQLSTAGNTTEQGTAIMDNPQHTIVMNPPEPPAGTMIMTHRELTDTGLAKPTHINPAEHERRRRAGEAPTLLNPTDDPTPT